ncbi:MAG TPA: carbohydrate binding domain-containing protein [Pyrinomonadaceae bacterium]|jgi:hypothetical protein
MSQLKLINVEATWRRVLLIVPLALALAGVWVVGRWCLGNTLAEFPVDAEIVRAATRLAPDDPQAHFTLAVFAKRTFSPEELQDALRHYERATSLSPNDYRLWMELGRVREQVGDTEGGERALRRSVEFAPHYAMPRWYLGNLLLRAGRQDEAFVELRRSADADPTLRPQIFATLWSLYGGDVERIAAAVGESAAGRAQLVEYLVRLKRMDEALRLWSSLGEREKREQRAAGEALRAGLLERGRFHGAMEVHRTVAPEGAAEVSVGNIINGGFESEVGGSNKHPFIWDVRPVAQTQIGLDVRDPHGGARSLRIAFNAPTSLAFANVSQLVPVEARTRYRLEYFVRTENLKSATTLIVQVLDNGDGARQLANSAQVADGTHDWQQVTLDFTTSPQTEAILMRIVRPSCTEEACPIFGKVWYDDFNLQRIGGDAAGARAANAGDDGGRGKASGER